MTSPVRPGRPARRSTDEPRAATRTPPGEREPADEQDRGLFRFVISPPPSIAPGAAVRKAVAVLRGAASGALVVLDRGDIVGILSERDLVLRVLGRRLDPDATVVREVMSVPVIRVPSSTSLDAALHLMSSRRLRHLVVTDEATNRIGLLSFGTLTRVRIATFESEMRTLQQSTNDALGG